MGHCPLQRNVRGLNPPPPYPTVRDWKKFLAWCSSAQLKKKWWSFDYLKVVNLISNSIHNIYCSFFFALAFFIFWVENSRLLVFFIFFLACKEFGDFVHFTAIFLSLQCFLTWWWKIPFWWWFCRCISVMISYTW